MSRLIDADKLHSEFMKMSEFKPNSEIGEPTCGCTRRLVYHISEGIRKINEQPTVDAEPIRHGHWIRTEAYPHRVVCSECHKTYVRNENIIEGRYKGDEIVPIYCTEAEYCPHCGALMDEVEE